MSDLTNEIRRIMSMPGMCTEPAAFNSHLCGLCADDQLNGR